MEQEQIQAYFTKLLHKAVNMALNLLARLTHST